MSDNKTNDWIRFLYWEAISKNVSPQTTFIVFCPEPKKPNHFFYFVIISSPRFSMYKLLSCNIAEHTHIHGQTTYFNNGFSHRGPSTVQASLSSWECTKETLGYIVVTSLLSSQMQNGKLSALLERKSISQFQQITQNLWIDFFFFFVAVVFVCVFSYMTFNRASFAFNDQHFTSWELFKWHGLAKYHVALKGQFIIKSK